MIRPEKYQFNWKPKTKSKEDLQLIKDLEKLVKDLDLTKTQITRQALNNFVKKNKKMYSDAKIRYEWTKKLN